MEPGPRPAGGAEPPALLCVDPRETPVARAATLHLAPLPGTNVALMNGLLHEIIACGWVDSEYVDRHTVGYDGLADLVAEYPPERVADRLLGTAEQLLCTVLQGFYQSHQATAASVQVACCR